MTIDLMQLAGEVDEAETRIAAREFEEARRRLPFLEQRTERAIIAAGAEHPTSLELSALNRLQRRIHELKSRLPPPAG